MGLTRSLSGLAIRRVQRASLAKIRRRAIPHRLLSVLAGALLAGPMLWLAGCAPQNIRETYARDDAAAFQLVDRDAFETIDLVTILDPDGHAQNSHKGDATKWEKVPLGTRIDYAFDAFYSDYDSSTSAARRNRAQERILAASNQRCNAYKSGLQRSYSKHNFWLGSLSTAAGIGGAVATGVNTARYLAGASGLFSGIRTEWNQDYLANLGVNVIVTGIEAKQKDVYSQIAQNGQNKPIDIYPVEAAVKDALYYHGLCSVLTGLETASSSIKIATDPGIDAATVTMLKVKNAQTVANGNPSDSGLAQKIQQIQSTSILSAGTPNGDSATNPSTTYAALISALAVYSTQLTAITTTKSDLDALSAALDTQCKSKALAANIAALTAKAQVDAAATAATPALRATYTRALASESALGSGLTDIHSTLDTAIATYSKGAPTVTGAALTTLQTALNASITGLTTQLASICP